MSEITVLIADSTYKFVEQAAGLEGISVSEWARLQLEMAAQRKTTWPPDYFRTLESMGGTEIVIPDDPFPSDDGTTDTQ